MPPRFSRSLALRLPSINKKLTKMFPTTKSKIFQNSYSFCKLFLKINFLDPILFICYYIVCIFIY